MSSLDDGGDSGKMNPVGTINPVFSPNLNQNEYMEDEECILSTINWWNDAVTQCVFLYCCTHFFVYK